MTSTKLILSISVTTSNSRVTSTSASLVTKTMMVPGCTPVARRNMQEVEVPVDGRFKELELHAVGESEAGQMRRELGKL